MRYREIMQHLDHLEQCAGIAQNCETKEPLYYDMINEISVIRDYCTPLHVKVLMWVRCTYQAVCFKTRIKKPSDLIPF